MLKCQIKGHPQFPEIVCFCCLFRKEARGKRYCTTQGKMREIPDSVRKDERDKGDYWPSFCPLTK
ncbi:MAG: hypothetical protein WC373_13635 [Smithella sp.]